MKTSIPLLMALLFIAACKSPEKKDDNKNERVTPVLSFIQGQVAQIDTSLFAIRRIEILDSLHSDTIDISRTEFRAQAKDFLDIPDISLEKYKDQYKESQTYDQDLKLISFLTLPKSTSQSSDIQKQEVIIKPDADGGKIRTIYIDREITTKDSSVIKKMIWQVDEYFQVLTLKQLPGQPETTHILKVTWKDYTKPE
ncbi:MAG: hypothetical protein E6H07_01470 [Bacteroidetes bacterium]|nr:MAG: hypothetical protein E6H07_01470 [Bacteroidota bacterium]